MVKRLIDKTGLSEIEVASALFPGRKHAILALRRIIAGNAYLDMQQLEKLMELAGGNFEEAIIDNIEGSWKAQTHKNGSTTLTKKLWTAEIHSDGSLHLLKQGEPKKVQVIYEKAITMPDLIKTLDKLVKTF